MTIQKNDFIEIEFTAKIKDSGEIFDTNIKADAEKAKLNIKEIKPFSMAVGHGMLIPGLDESLVGKEVGKEYVEEFSPEKAFGPRSSSLVRMIPLKAFTEQKIFPQKGMQLALDNTVVKIVSVSGGRVLVDFNNPLAGKQVIYHFKILKKITEEKDKINALQDFLFRQRFEFSVAGKEVTFKVPEQMQQVMKIFEKPFEEIIGLKIKSEVVKKATTQSEKSN